MHIKDLIVTFATSTKRTININEITDRLQFNYLSDIAEYLFYDDVDCLWEDFGSFCSCSPSNRIGEYAFFELSQDVANFAISLIIPFDKQGRRSGLARLIVTYEPENLEIQRLELSDDFSANLHSDITSDIEQFLSISRLVNGKKKNPPSTQFRIDCSTYTEPDRQQTMH
ncbi:hypothetical protein [Loktanella salsilacus]|uniref:hypothetical protein n=1 Tax=Loktanella salsilacus TaxID=195913 RepID=UPI0037351685